MTRKLTRVALVLLLLALPLVAWLTYLSHVINKQLAEIRSASLPSNGEELNQWYGAAGEKSNSAVIIAKAFELMRDFSDDRSNAFNNFKLPPGRVPISSQQANLLRGYVALNEPMLQKVDEALKLPASHYSLDFKRLLGTELPHLAPLADAARLYEYQAALATEAGETKKVATNIEKILQLAHVLDNEPLLISQLVRLQLIAKASTTLERRANAGAFGPSEIKNLAAAFSQTPVTNISAQVLIGERAITIPYFRMTKKQYLEINPPHNSDDPTKGPPLPFNGSPILRLTGYYELDYGSYLLGVRKAIMLAEQPPPANLRLDSYLAHVGEESTKRQRTLSGMLFSSYSGIAHRENKGIAQQRLALTSLAIESYRNKTGSLPKELSALVPDFMADTPEDPFTGTDLKYRRTEKGYLLYSVGPDLEDNNGLEEAAKKESADKKSYDVTFMVDR